MATYNRAHLLVRSLKSYAAQEFDNKEMELVVIDDGGDDGTDKILDMFSRRAGVRTVYLRPMPKEPGSWRDCGAVLNYGIRASAGRHIILTHPEVMPGRASVRKCVEVLEDYEKANQTNRARGSVVGQYASCKVYYMGRHDQEKIDTVPWPEEGNTAVRQISGFYTDDPNGNPDYRHEVTDLVGKPGFRIKTWESWVFGGCSRETWRRLGGMVETSKWGSVDIAFHSRRHALGIGNWTCPDDDSIVVHQNHDGPGDVQTPRDMAAWQQELRDFPRTPSELCFPKIDNLGW